MKGRGRKGWWELKVKLGKEDLEGLGPQITLEGWG